VRNPVSAKRGSVRRITVCMIDIACVGVFITGGGDMEEGDSFLQQEEMPGVRPKLRIILRITLGYRSKIYGS
jgi:hypothetical protein